jgi:hypothetical protein
MPSTFCWMVVGGGVDTNTLYTPIDYQRYALASSPRQVWISQDAITWTQVQFTATGGGSNTVLSVNHDGNGRVLVGSSNPLTTSLYTSTNIQSNGTASWTLAPTNIPTELTYDIRYANGRWVVVGGFGTSAINVSYSLDGINWNVSSIVGGPGIISVDYNPNTNTWLGGGIGSVYQSVDQGINWTNPSSFPSLSFVTLRMRYLNGYWFAIGFDSFGFTPAGYISSDGTTWTALLGSLPTKFLFDIAYGNGKWILVGESTNALTTICTSTDGLNWNAILSGGFQEFGNGIVYRAGKWVAVGGPGASKHIATSTDGLNWSFVSQPMFESYEYGLGVIALCDVIPIPAQPQPSMAQQFQNIHLPSHNDIVPYNYFPPVPPLMPNIQPPPPGTYKQPREAKNVINRCFGSLVPNRFVPDPCAQPRSPHEKRDIQKNCSGDGPVAPYNTRLNNYQRTFGVFQVGSQQSPKARVVATWPPAP